MREYLNFYIGGTWVEPAQESILDVINPANEQIAGRISLASSLDVDRAALAARHAFRSWSQSTRADRIALLENIAAEYERRRGDIADAVTEEMGAPAMMSHASQAGSGLNHIKAAITVLRDFAFAEPRGSTMIVKEPIGVCGLITPWNWPLNQIACKVAPALATGCTIILKPSEIAPFSAVIFAEVLHAAGVPAGVFNLVNGDGPGAGHAIASHPQVDMVSFMGSTRAGVAIATAAAPTVKRVAQELGGKSPVIVLDDADFPKAVTAVVRHIMGNSGQSCNAPTRLLVPEARMDEASKIAKAAAEALVVGDPLATVDMGPVVSSRQWTRIQDLIAAGVAEGATLITGGLGLPEGLHCGYYVKPTIFAHVENSMTIAREEIFGPVLSVLGYNSTAQAIEIANDTDYGLAAYIWGGDITVIREVAAQLRAGRVGFNGVGGDSLAPFGGYKMSGNGREWGDYGFAEFLEVKAMLGYEPA